jgi:hypothetical protein
MEERSMTISQGMFTFLIATSIGGAAVLMVILVGYFIYKLKKNEVW